MAEIKYPLPVTARLYDEEREIIKRIQALASPGSNISQSDAIRISLHEWAKNHPVGVAR